MTYTQKEKLILLFFGGFISVRLNKNYFCINNKFYNKSCITFSI